MLNRLRHNHLLLLAALAAMGVVIGSALHVHHGDDGLECWLCIAAVGIFGIVAIIAITTFQRRIIALLGITAHLSSYFHTSVTPASRAPPLIFDSAIGD